MPSRRLSYAVFLFGVAWLLSPGPALRGQANPASGNNGSQTDADSDLLRAFAGASIKQVKSGTDMMTLKISDDGIVFTAAAVDLLVQEAFEVEGNRILGLPPWTKSDRYDIQTKVDEIDVSGWRVLRREQRKLVLQALLKSRFNLSFHHETKKRPTYSLVVAKDGPKLHVAKPGDPNSDGSKGPDGKSGNGAATHTRGRIVIQGSNISALVKRLSEQGLDYPVIDETGLTDLYDITLQWSPVNESAKNGSPPPLFTALEEQLGLKLKFDKRPIDIIVVDHIDKPSAN
jgi:uncharacterized protein (TIGR03435 family)